MHSCRDLGLCWPETYFEVTVMRPLPVFSHTQGCFETERVISSEKSPVVKPPQGNCNAGYTSCRKSWAECLSRHRKITTYGGQTWFHPDL